MRRKMIDGETGNYTISTLVKSQDEVILYWKDVGLHDSYKHICSENVSCTDQTVALKALHWLGSEDVHLCTSEGDRLQVNITHYYYWSDEWIACVKYLKPNFRPEIEELQTLCTDRVCKMFILFHHNCIKPFSSLGLELDCGLQFKTKSRHTCDIVKPWGAMLTTYVYNLNNSSSWKIRSRTYFAMMLFPQK